MSIYKIVDLYIDSEEMPIRYGAFLLKDADARIKEQALKIRFRSGAELAKPFEPVCEVSGLRIGNSEGSWVYEDIATGLRMQAAADYSAAELSEEVKNDPELWGFLLQLFLECRLLDEGVLTLHSSCIELEGKAFAFSGHSGCGKSTRALQWVRSFGAGILSGDRPAVDVRKKLFYGIPWDGKEQIFRNDSASAGAILQVRRSSFTRIRKLSANQARNFLISQIVVPMWDSERAMEAMVLLSRLIKEIPVYRLFCDQDEKAAEETRKILFDLPEHILEEREDMKLNEGFVLKSMAGEFVLMPTGENITKFNGSVLLNEVSAFILRKMEAGPISREDLTELILAEYDADRKTVQEDLDELMESLIGMGVVSED